MSESPYFRKRRHPSKDMSHIGSRHFVRSPSSALGSVLSMGPFLSTLTDLDFPSKDSCSCAEAFCKRDDRFCSACTPIIESATSHFLHCPVFAQTYNSLLSNLWRKENESLIEIKGRIQGDGSPKSEKSDHLCLQQAGLILNRSVRHLCLYKCYYRAFAPARNWHSLRLSVSEITGRSPDHIVDGWRCRLVQHKCERDQGENAADETIPDTPRGAKRFPSTATPTVFVDPDGNSFPSENLLLQHLGLSSSTKKRKRKCPRTESPSVRKRLELEPKTENYRINPAQKEAESCHESQGTSTLVERSRRRQFVWLDGFPSSPFGLLEELFSLDPWRLLLSTIMLNRTTRVQVDAVLHSFLCIWPDPESAVLALTEEVCDVIRPLGICQKRAKAIIRFSQEYLALTKRKKEEGKTDAEADIRLHDLLVEKQLMKLGNGRNVLYEEFIFTKDEVLGLYNCGGYAWDAYQIFVQRRNHIATSDHALQYYVDFYRGLNWTDRGRQAELRTCTPVSTPLLDE